MVDLARRKPGPVMPMEVDWTSQAWRQHPQARGLKFWFQPSVRMFGDVVSGGMMSPSAVKPAIVPSPEWGAAGLFDRASNTYLQKNQVIDLTGSFTYRVVVNGTTASGVFGGGTRLLFDDYSGGTGAALGHYYNHSSSTYASHLSWYIGSYQLAAHSVLPANVFSDLVITYNHITGDAISYINGFYDQTTPSLSPMVQALINPHIANASDGHTEGFDGRIALLQLRDVAISPAEVWNLYAPQTRDAMIPLRSHAKVFAVTTPPPTTIYQRRRPGIYRVGSRSVA